MRVEEIECARSNRRGSLHSTVRSLHAYCVRGSLCADCVRGSLRADCVRRIQQPWYTTDFTFVAASNETTIRFTSNEWHTNAFGPAIDGVSVVQLPEPTSVAALFGFGAMGLLLAARRKFAK